MNTTTWKAERPTEPGTYRVRDESFGWSAEVEVYEKDGVLVANYDGAELPLTSHASWLMWRKLS